jgi:hypothetical protein
MTLSDEGSRMRKQPPHVKFVRGRSALGVDHTGPVDSQYSQGARNRLVQHDPGSP